MISNLVTVTAGTNIKEVAESLSKHNFHSLSVIEDKEIVEMITITDLVKHLLDQY